MRKVVVRQTEREQDGSVNERLVALLAAGLQRLFEKETEMTPETVDFGGDESVTTTYPNDGAGEDHET